MKSYTLEVKNNKNNGTINPVRTQFIAWRQDNSLNRITDGVLSALSNNLLDWIFLFRLVYVQDIPYFLNCDIFRIKFYTKKKCTLNCIIQKQLCNKMYEVYGLNTTESFVFTVTSYLTASSIVLQLLTIKMNGLQFKKWTKVI